MPEIATCPMCQKKLRVPEDLIGQEVRCPTCGHTFTATLATSVPPPPLEPPREEPRERSRPEEDADRRGERERPSSRDRPSRRKRDEEEDERERPRRRSRWGDDDDEVDRRPSRRSRRQEPDRGGAVITLGILGLVFSLPFCCCVIGLPLSIIAVVMGHSDLGAMNRGSMNEAGRGATTGGVVCGWIGIALSVLTGIGALIMVAMDSGGPGGQQPFGRPRRF